MSEFYTVKEVAEKLKVNIYTVYKWVQSGRLEAMRFNGSDEYRITNEALDKFMKPTIEDKAEV